MDAYVDECAKVGDVGDDAGQFHALAEIVDAFDALGELELRL